MHNTLKSNLIYVLKHYATQLEDVNNVFRHKSQKNKYVQPQAQIRRCSKKQSVFADLLARQEGVVLWLS